MITPDALHLLSQTRKEADSLAQKLPPHKPGEVLVRLRQGEFETELVDSFEATVLHRFDEPLLHLKLPQEVSTAAAVAAMGKLDSVEYVEPNHLFELQNVSRPNDLDERLWGLHNGGQEGGKPDADIDAPEAWAVHTGSADGPLIAVLDTGVDLQHPDLTANLWTNPGEVADGQDNDGNGVVDDLHGYNALDQNGRPVDGHSHGTHCIGTIAAKGNNGVGVAGINWEAQVMAVKIYGDQGQSDAASIVRGIRYATANGARITSNSWGGNTFNRSIYDAFADSPAFHVAAAGNDSRNNDDRPFYPASFDLDNIISVAATSRHDEKASFSNYGAKSVDIAAPGISILSTIPGGYGLKDGTSMAAPHVAGAAALIADLYPDASNREIKARLLNNVDSVAALEGKVNTAGRLNAARALEADDIAPGVPQNFRVLQTEGSAVKLGWIAGGDDGESGRASRYDVRMSDRPITDQASFAQAQPVPAPSPKSAGQAEQLEIPVVPSGRARQLYFAVRAEDNVGRLSELQATSATLPAADLPFEDPIDGDTSKWIADEGWAQIREPGRGLVWTDSPDGNYENDRETMLTSRPIKLEGYKNSKLMFEAKHSLEGRHDKVKVQVYKGGWWRPWRTLATFTGDSDWKAHSLELSRFDGKEITLRFVLDSDDSVAKDGFYLDNVVIAAEPQAL